MARRGELPAAFARIKEAEDEFRRYYAQEPTNPALARASEHLIDLYASNNIDTLKYRPLTFDETALTRIYRPRETDIVEGAYAVAATSLAAFESSWQRLTNGALAQLDWRNVVVAGGSVLAALRGGDGGAASSSTSSDVDLFLYGLSEQEASRKVAAIYEAVCAATNENTVPIVRTTNAVTILGRYPTPHIQIVLRLYSSPAEVLMGFDIDCCTVAYTGSRVLLLPRARHALTTRYNVLDLSRRSLTYELRLDKYGRRGFGVMLPGVDLARVNAAIYTYLPSELHGLSKLLALERIYTLDRRPVPSASQRAELLKSSLARTALRRGTDVGENADAYLYRDHEDESDYSNVVIPWGPSWPPNLVVSMLNRDDRSVFFGSRRRDPALHQHVLVSGIEGVLNGTSCWCSQCAAGVPASGVPGVPGPIAWTTIDPGRQLLTGSFHPLPEHDWQTQAFDTQLREQPVTFVQASARTVQQRKAQQPTQRPVFGAKQRPPKGRPVGAFGTTAAPSAQSQHPPKGRPVGAFGTTAAPSGRPAPASQLAAPRQQQQQLQSVPAGQLMLPMTSIAQVPTHEAPSFDSAVANLRQFASMVDQPPPPSATAQAVPQSHSAKLLLLLARLSRDGKITTTQKSKLKDLVIARNAAVISALEVFEFDSDIHELVDTLQRICLLVAAPDAAPPQ